MPRSPAEPNSSPLRPIACVLYTAGIVLTGLVPAAGASAVVSSPVVAHRAPPLPAPPRNPSALGDDAAKLLGEFGRLYTAVRGGDIGAGADLIAVADALAADGTRPEAARLARFYAGLSADALIAGQRQSDRYRLVAAEVSAAATSGVSGAQWIEDRQEILEELEAVGDEWKPGDDVDGPARALGLAAYLRADTARKSVGAQARAEASRAIELADRALDLFEQAGLVRPTFEARLARGRALRIVGRAGEAWETFAHVRLLAIERDDENYSQLALLGLIRLARGSGALWTRNRLLDELLAVVEPSESWSIAREHALRLHHEGYAEAARQFLLRLEPPRQHQDSDHQYRHLLCLFSIMAGDLEDARQRLAQLPAGPESALLEGWLGLESGAPDRAVLAAQRALSHKLSPRPHAAALSLLGSALLAEGRPDEAYEAIEEALALAAEQRELVAEPGNENIIGEWLGVESIATLSRALAARGDSLQAAVPCEAFQSLRLRRALGTESEALDAEGLRAWAARYEYGLVTWAVGFRSSIVVHISQAGVATAVPIDRGRLDVAHAVRRLREAVLNGDGNRLQDLGPRIAEELLPESLRKLLAAGAENRAVADGSAPRLLLLPHGPLEDLPWESIWTGSGWMGESVALTVLPGLTSAAPEAQADWQLDTPWLLLDASSGKQDQVPLPGAAREIEALAKLHPGSRVLRGSETTLSKLRGALDAGMPLHAAAHLSRDCGHASASFSPLGLALEDGTVLCTHRIAEWRPVLDLVVLSACGTAEGRLKDSEGVQGLARAFLEAGTRNLLVTQWPVDDAYASRAAEFFHAALEDGRHPSEAARITRLSLREEGAPYADWAAWRLLGRD